MALDSMEPQQAVQVSFGLVDAVSPQFVRIYNQAEAAEAAGLDEVCGLAYRKSLEFLIKDFCIMQAPNDAETIKRMRLGDVIRDRLTDRRTQIAAERATWLGNDEAHYVRKWEKHDVQDLKSLLRIAVSGITGELELAAHLSRFENAST